MAKEFPSSWAAPEEGKHTLQPGRATSLLYASFSPLKTEQRQGKEAIPRLERV